MLRVEQTTQGEVPAGYCSVSHDVATNTVQAMVVLQFSERRETNSKKKVLSAWFLVQEYISCQNSISIDNEAGNSRHYLWRHMLVLETLDSFCERNKTVGISRQSPLRALQGKYPCLYMEQDKDVRYQ